MTGFRRSLKPTRAGLVLISPESCAAKQVITRHYLQRTLEVQAIQDEPDRSRPLRLTGPAIAPESAFGNPNITGTDERKFPLRNPHRQRSGRSLVRKARSVP